MILKIQKYIISAIAGGVTTMIATSIFFFAIGYGGDSLDGLLLNPNFQSTKLIDVLINMEPIPYSIDNPVILLVIFIFFAGIHSVVFGLIESALPRKNSKKIIYFALIIFLMSYVWFEVFAPFNLLGEPLWLVLIELIFWIPVAVVEAAVIVSVMKTELENS